LLHNKYVLHITYYMCYFSEGEVKHGYLSLEIATISKLKYPCFTSPSELWHCWLGDRKGFWSV